MSKVVGTSEVIKKLQEYEEKNGMGVVISISTICNGDRTDEYEFEIANDSGYNRVYNNKDNHYKKTHIEISSVDDKILFNYKPEYTFRCEFMDENEEFLSVLVYENNDKKYEIWINMSESPETMYYMNGNKPSDIHFEDILIKYLEEKFSDYFLPEFVHF